MKSFAITAAIATLCVASTSATNPRRRRTTQTQHKSTGARAVSDESYDPYLGMERKLEGSMSMSMSMKPVVPPTTKSPTPSPTESSAATIGTTVSVLAAAGAMMLI